MQFTEDHLKVHFGRRFQEDWDDAFVEANARHETRHGQTKLLWSNLLGLALVEGDMQRKRDPRDIQLVDAHARAAEALARVEKAAGRGHTPV
jgi:hypothetical protein